MFSAKHLQSVRRDWALRHAIPAQLAEVMLGSPRSSRQCSSSAAALGTTCGLGSWRQGSLRRAVCWGDVSLAAVTAEWVSGQARSARLESSVWLAGSKHQSCLLWGKCSRGADDENLREKGGWVTQAARALGSAPHRRHPTCGQCTWATSMSQYWGHPRSRTPGNPTLVCLPVF